MSFTDNKAVTFSQNKADAVTYSQGGAIYMTSNGATMEITTPLTPAWEGSSLLEKETVVTLSSMRGYNEVALQDLTVTEDSIIGSAVRTQP